MLSRTQHAGCASRRSCLRAYHTSRRTNVHVPQSWFGPSNSCRIDPSLRKSGAGVPRCRVWHAIEAVLHAGRVMGSLASPLLAPGPHLGYDGH